MTHSKFFFPASAFGRRCVDQHQRIAPNGSKNNNNNNNNNNNKNFWYPGYVLDFCRVQTFFFSYKLCLYFRGLRGTHLYSWKCNKERDSLLCSFCVRVVDTTLILTDFSSFFKPLPKSKNTLISASNGASQQKYLRQRWYSLLSSKICTAKKQTNKKSKQSKTKRKKENKLKLNGHLQFFNADME